jgi:hypothetical protein
LVVKAFKFGTCYIHGYFAAVFSYARSLYLHWFTEVGDNV